jgi:hypothetical protein
VCVARREYSIEGSKNARGEPPPLNEQIQSNYEEENGLCKQKSVSDLKITYSVKIFRA